MKKYIAVVGQRCPETCEKRLLSLPEVTDVVRLPCDVQIADPIADHPDSLICVFDGKLYVHSEYAKVAKNVLSYICKGCALELIAVECERGDVYPLDCGFNALTIPDRHTLIGRKKSLAEPLRELCRADTKQGYAGCTSLYAGGHIITADPSIERTSLACDIPVYKISGRGISLPGYDEGFIGGAGGAFERTVCLFGSPDHSESGREVLEFCRLHSLALISLEDGILTDRGGIKFIPIN